MPGRPMSLNGYMWVEGNVPNAVDPNGMVAITSVQSLAPLRLASTLNGGGCHQTIANDVDCPFWKDFWGLCDMPQNCENNLDAVFPAPNLNRIESVGFMIGAEGSGGLTDIKKFFKGGTSVVVGMSGGGGMMFLFEKASGQTPAPVFSKCQTYIVQEYGFAIGADLGQGIFGAVVWTTSEYDNAAGPSFNTSFDFFSAIPGTNSVTGLSRTNDDNCNYLGFTGLAPTREFTRPTISRTYGFTSRPLLNCYEAAEELGVPLVDYAVDLSLAIALIVGDSGNMGIAT